MRLEFRESGGIARLRRGIVLEDERITLLDRDEQRLERGLALSQVEEVAKLVRRLQEAKPRRFYGKTPVSDPMTFLLSIENLDSEPLTIEVTTDPADQPPSEFSALVQWLRHLTSP